MGVLVLGLLSIGGFALSTQRSIVSESRQSNADTQIASVYENTRFWVGQEESLERKYRLEPSPAVLRLHDEAEHNVNAYLNSVFALDGSPPTRRLVSRVLRENAEYVAATKLLFAAVHAKDARLVRYYDHVVTDPIFTALQVAVYGRAALAAHQALGKSASLKSSEAAALQAGIIALVLAVGLLGGLMLVLRRERLVQAGMRAAELERLHDLAITDPLTELRNHRAFQEDLAQELQRAGRTGTPVSLVMLDVDDLKVVNDTHGHQRGDELLIALARAITVTPRGTDRAYRIGGDEFAVILHDAGVWAAFEFAQRLSASLTENGKGGDVRASAGISQALGFRSKDDLIREADLALIHAKRFGQQVVIYTPEMTPFEESSNAAQDEHHTQTLARALAFAVDAKDSYTRSHCQTVATLSSLIATTLGVEDGELMRIRLAGLLHDVGKIGIPDSILKKPAALTAEELETMRTHSVLGESIVLAAEMPVEARWIRHHHERIDGGGYPDGLSGEAIPLASRILHVADAFEAMTSDRPYRAAPGHEFAIEELQRHAGTQFDHDVVDALLRAIDSSSRDGSPVGLAPAGRTSTESLLAPVAVAPLPGRRPAQVA